MIVDRDFLDHWRTRMLVDELGGDELAPLYLLRLWAHCQSRRGARFALPAAALKAICRAEIEAEALERALIKCKWIAREGDHIEVLGWAEKNATLVAAWTNGAKGGRPNREPTGNPRDTHEEPLANPRRSDKRREEKIRKEHPPKPPKGGEVAGFKEFWEAYPRKQARARAVKAFARVAQQLPAMLEALVWQRQQESWTKDEGKFIPLAATWLNDRRWEDERPIAGEPSRELPWSESWSGIQQRASELGLAPWDNTKEDSLTYTRGVMAAHLAEMEH